MRRALCLSRLLNLVCKIPLLLFGLSKTNTIGYISPYSRMTNWMLWGHLLSIAPEISSMEGGARFHLDTIHNRPDAFVT